MVQYFPVITGSLTVNGDIIVSGTSSMSASNSVSSSYAYSASSAISSSYAYSASSAVNSFSASKAVSSSYADTASFSNDFTVLGNLTVYGTQSVQYITSSQLNVSDNVITVNVASPGVRFGGLSVFDSGSLSSEATASLFWDSQNNHWIYQRESGSTYDGGMLISGPRNSAGLGNEQGTTNCMLLVGQGGDHLTSSMIYHDSARTCIPNTLITSCIGIGTTTPCNLMHIRSAITGDFTLARFANSPGTGNEGSFIGFETGYVCGLSLIGAKREGAEDDASIIFSPMLNQASCERMRITSGGRVGIGVISPSAQLDVYQVAGPLDTTTCSALLLRAGGNSNIFCHNQILFGYNGTANYAHGIKTRHNSNGTCDNAIDFYTWRCGDAISTPVGQYVMTIAGDGRLGIGTCFPLTLLDARCAVPENCNGSVLNSHPITTFVVNASGGGQRGLQFGGPTGGVVSPVFLKVFGTGNRFSILNESNCENLIVTSGGTVTKPLQPAFQVYRRQGADCIISNTAEQRIAFECIRFDIGSNTSNCGLFRAPLCGRYAFSSTVRYDGASNASSYLRLYFAINGCSGCPTFTYGHTIAGPGSYSTDYYSMSVSSVLNLNIGDCVTVNGGLNSGTVGVQFESQFSGYFLG